MLCLKNLAKISRLILGLQLMLKFSFDEDIKNLISLIKSACILFDDFSIIMRTF